ncbi:hypothetical protein [Paenibacillus sp. YAF4_2]
MKSNMRHTACEGEVIDSDEREAAIGVHPQHAAQRIKKKLPQQPLS